MSTSDFFFSSSSLQADEDQPDVCDVSFDPEPEMDARARMKHSRSNPDISNINLGVMGAGISQYYQPVRSACPEHVLKIYRSDQTFKYLTVYKVRMDISDLECAYRMSICPSIGNDRPECGAIGVARIRHGGECGVFELGVVVD